MLERFWALGIIFGLFAVVLYAPMQMYQGIHEMQFSTRDKSVKAWIPIYNMISAEMSYSGRASTIALSYVLVAIAVIFRIVVGKMSEPSTGIVTATVIVLWISFLAFYLTNVIFVFVVLHDSECMSLFSTILLSLVFPLGQDYIGKYLPKRIKSFMVKESTF